MVVITQVSKPENNITPDVTCPSLTLSSAAFYFFNILFSQWVEEILFVDVKMILQE
jgi:hypothetical protein